MWFIFLGYNAQSIYTIDVDFHDQKELREAQHKEQKDRPNLTKEQEAELNKTMNSDGSLKMPVASRCIRNKVIMHAIIKANSVLQETEVSLNPLDHAQTIALGVVVPVADSLEYDSRKYYTDLSDDEIENKMLGERMFLLSIAGYCALCNPASAAVMLSGSLLYSMYTLQQRINFREKYKQDPIQTIDDHKNQSPELKSIKDFAIATAIGYIPEIIVGAATK
ncbi:MAG: hypothetical protein Q8Q60_03420 [Candidatus Chromulinivorax sp.]|nr:hypothetical protein [Candidatus Chromulinivorax sp.]